MRLHVGKNEAMSRAEDKWDGIDRRQYGLTTESGSIAVQPILLRADFNAEASAAAFARLREPAQALKLGPFDWELYKQWRDEGRR
jgi:hypothetical protein